MFLVSNIQLSSQGVKKPNSICHPIKSKYINDLNLICKEGPFFSAIVKKFFWFSCYAVESIEKYHLLEWLWKYSGDRILIKSIVVLLRKIISICRRKKREETSNISNSTFLISLLTSLLSPDIAMITWKDSKDYRLVYHSFKVVLHCKNHSSVVQTGCSLKLKCKKILPCGQNM